MTETKSDPKLDVIKKTSRDTFMSGLFNVFCILLGAVLALYSQYRFTENQERIEAIGLRSVIRAEISHHNSILCNMYRNINSEETIVFTNISNRLFESNISNLRKLAALEIEIILTHYEQMRLAASQIERYNNVITNIENYNIQYIDRYRASLRRSITLSIINSRRILTHFDANIHRSFNPISAIGEAQRIFPTDFMSSNALLSDQQFQATCRLP